MTPRINLRKYLRKTSFTKGEWHVLKREYLRMEKKINLLRHKQSRLVVKLQCHAPLHQRLP